MHAEKGGSMGRKERRPDICVHRAFTNERPLLDLFADAYRVYFDEKKKMKSSFHIFDSGENSNYNETAENKKEDKNDGSAA